MSRIPQLRAELVRAAARAYEPAATRASRRPRVRLAAVPALAVVVAAVVAVGAVTLIGRHGGVAGSNRGASAGPVRGPRQTSAPPSPHSPEVGPIRRALTGNGIGAARFGQDPTQVRTVIDRLLHRTGGRYTPERDCRIDHLIAWRSPRAQSPTTVLATYFWRSRFVGYDYGRDTTRTAPGLPARGIALATSRGLKIGDRLAQGQRLYGRAFRLSFAQGGTWTARTATGTIDGFAYGTSSAYGPNDGKISPRSLVATIDAGHVGCPATSP